MQTRSEVEGGVSLQLKIENKERAKKEYTTHPKEQVNTSLVYEKFPDTSSSVQSPN